MNKKCQVFTPENYVEELLNTVGYVDQIYGKKILENSCGEGNILVVIVRRYIETCKQQGLSRTRIKNGLARDIYGVEIDIQSYNNCIENLNKVLQEENIKPVEWKIYNADYLRWDTKIKFDFVVGNPPYITYQELDDTEQEYVRDKFLSCKKGKFDYCYAFIEKSLNCLNGSGKMAYLIPSSIFKTVFGADLRNIMKPYIQEIKDYTVEKVFDSALVKSSIILLDSDRSNNVLHYVDMAGTVDRNIKVNDLGDKWFFINNPGEGKHRFGDSFQISHVVATLLNEAYVLKEEDYTETEGYIICNGHNIERAMVRETATPRSLRYNKVEKIIFPYDYHNGQLIKYSEEDFEQRFPGTTAYLNDFRKKLDDRESDHSAKWFEYGRSQALAGLNQEKLLMSTIITENVHVYGLSQECIPYAGMYIVPIANDEQYTLEYAKHILESKEFMQYVLDVGIHISGNSLRITSKDIADYRF